ncbi:MAG: hypothetical protein ACE5FU_05935, partial [Nitrospinota bacterium]
MEHEKLYRRRLKRLRFVHRRLKRVFNRISTCRGVLVFLALISYFFLKGTAPPLLTYGLLTLFVSLFSLLVIFHNRVSLYTEKIKSLITINEESVERLEDRWAEFAWDGSEYCKAENPSLTDLHIFGKNSLFQMVQQVATKKGADTLAGLLSQHKDFSTLKQRQDAVQELAPSLSFRHRLLQEGRAISSLIDAGQLLKWSQTPPVLLNKTGLLVLRRVLLFSSLALFLLYLLAGFPPWFVLSLALQLLLFVSLAGKLQAAYKPALSTESSFLAYAGMFRAIERKRVESPFLRELKQKIKIGGTPLSERMKELEKINHQLSICFSMIYPFINTLLLWDIYFLHKQERWKEDMRPYLEGCFKALGTFEALSSLAGLAFDNPEYNYPDIDEKHLPFAAEKLGHPLIPKGERISNDIEIPEEGAVALITGSNMSGKSTFIRTVGITMLLGFSGAPVPAKRLSARPCQVMTCIQVLDSLRLHVSHFYAEVQGIKRILDSIFTQGRSPSCLPVLYLIDEIFTGTNTRERLLASKGILLKLTSSRSYGLLTTHDLDLV